MDKDTLLIILALLIFPVGLVVIDVAAYDPANAYKVVGQIGKCDVIRFNPGPMQRFQYFTRCP